MVRSIVVIPFCAVALNMGNDETGRINREVTRSYTEFWSGLAVDFPARPVRFPCLLRATEEGGAGEEFKALRYLVVEVPMSKPMPVHDFWAVRITLEPAYGR